MYSSVDVHNRLQELDIPHEIFKLPEPAASLERAAAALGLEPGELARVELFRVDGVPVIVILPGDREVDVSKLKDVTGGEEVAAVPRGEMSSLTGYHASVVPPVGLKAEMQAYIDYYTLKEDVIYTGGGEPSKILKIRSYDLVRATDGETVDVVLPLDEARAT